MKILVLFTGGTIGSDEADGIISLKTAIGKKLLSLFLQAEGEVAHFTVRTPYSILSENLSANNVNVLATYLRQAQEEDFDGIIVTHGTDTLHYAAAATDFVVRKRRPILFVSAAYPLSDTRGNGLDNFRAAVRFIGQKPPAKTYIAYKNQEEQAVRIHLATRLLGYGEKGVDLYSLGGACALVDNEKNTVDFLSSPKSDDRAIVTTYCTDPKILVAESYPENGYDYDLTGYHAVIFSPYHSATLNTASQALIAFCRRARALNIPLFVSGATGEKAYESTKDFDELGVVPLPITRAALYVKCWLARSVSADVKDFVLTPLTDEFLD